MINLIRLGDAINHGGKVVSASETMSCKGKAVARKGDTVECKKHYDVSPNVIEEGDPTMTDRGIPVARHGHRATCGCSVISSLIA
ncbi:PAAR domain-containing protein [Paraburkholderia bannensis]|uniref:PAAR domain-containing protein n=1 Tax=Paraburkholderia bannensis TaxID=765414 RepID=UPI002AB6BF11|nr:PAAR domain-containing protein [Paraburkholderia bannensis]